jgi:hypothetical protein
MKEEHSSVLQAAAQPQSPSQLYPPQVIKSRRLRVFAVAWGSRSRATLVQWKQRRRSKKRSSTLCPSPCGSSLPLALAHCYFDHALTAAAFQAWLTETQRPVVPEAVATSHVLRRHLLPWFDTVQLVVTEKLLAWQYVVMCFR